MSLFVSLVLIRVTTAQSIFDPPVYNFYFYLNTNSDLTAAGIETREQAQIHWSEYGINEGRQACASFHTRQFLDNYPALKQEFGSNYSAAIEYYLNIGYDAKMFGYTPNKGAYGRYTISSLNYSNSPIWLSGSDRMSGAIDAISWNNTEFINCWDHGRELQMAVTTNYGECFNPTEAGSSVDLMKDSTTSILQSINIENNTYQTVTMPAFWLIPGQCEAACGCAKNTKNVSQFRMRKSVQIGYEEIENVIIYKNDVLIPMDLNQTQIEAPTAYLNAMFDTFYSIDLAQNGQLTHIQINDTMGGHSSSINPVIISTKNGDFAQGILAKAHPTRNYALFNFVGLNPPSDGTSKWSVVTFFQNVAANTLLTFENFICIGTIADVQQCMLQIYNKFN